MLIIIENYDYSIVTGYFDHFQCF